MRKAYLALTWIAVSTWALLFVLSHFTFPSVNTLIQRHPLFWFVLMLAVGLVLGMFAGYLVGKVSSLSADRKKFMTAFAILSCIMGVYLLASGWHLAFKSLHLLSEIPHDGAMTSAIGFVYRSITFGAYFLLNGLILWRRTT